jgi:hypothetical protein
MVHQQCKCLLCRRIGLYRYPCSLFPCACRSWTPRRDRWGCRYSMLDVKRVGKETVGSAILVVVSRVECENLPAETTST